MNWLLIVVIILIITLSVYGCRKGFVDALVPFVSGLLSLLLIFFLKDWLLAYLFQWAIFQGEHILSRIVVILLLFALGTLAFRWVIKVLRLLTRLPLVKGVNKLLGLVLGCIEGFLLVWLFLYIIQVRQGMLFGLDISVQIEKSGFLKFLYENNLVSHLLNTLFGGFGM